jgi:hypothetical protein
MSNTIPKRRMTKLPLLIAVSVFSISMIFLWVVHYSEMNQAIIFIGGGYALMCFAFLVFQIGAFARAHVVYDEDVEGIKMKVFEVEQDDYKKKF